MAKGQRSLFSKLGLFTDICNNLRKKQLLFLTFNCARILAVWPFRYTYMKRYIILSLLLTYLISAFGQSGNQSRREPGEPPYIPEILIVATDEEATSLEQSGVIIWHRRGDMALALVPREIRESSQARARGIKGDVPHPRRAVPAMDVAKTWLGAPELLSGEGLPQVYSGNGVVVGFCDIYFDPNHINFKDSEGHLRVKKLIHYDEPYGIRTILETPEEIQEWTTDDSNGYHATHVAGIMAGSFNGNGYGGMAPGTDIVAATSQLYDMGVLAACEEIISYARSVGKPAVINLSLGSYTGPHDGTSLFNRYLGLLGKEAIICVAAGNAGDDHSSFRMDFTSSNPKWRVAIQGNDWIHFHITGVTEAWSRDSRPVGVRFLLYDKDTRSVVYESEPFNLHDGEYRLFECETDPELSSLMTGTVEFYGEVNKLNGRWMTQIAYDTTTTATESNSGGKWSRYLPALEFSAEPGVHADINSDAYQSFLHTIAGQTPPNAEWSVSDMATGENIVVVGMYNNRDHIPRLDGGERVFNIEPFHVNQGSGYATLDDGRVLPHSVAPGCGIISSCNRYYLETHPQSVAGMHAAETIDGITYYWASEGGTSMSTPYLAGTVATWLEALPDLTVDRVLEALANTNYLDYPDPQDPRNGQGWFQPYEGLKYLLASSGITPGTQQTAKIKLVRNGDSLDILNPTGRSLSISVYSADGLSSVPEITSSESIITLNAGSLRKGLNIISVNAPQVSPVTFKLCL